MDNFTSNREIVQNDELLDHLCSFFGFKELCSFWMSSKRIYEKSRAFKKHLRRLVMNVLLERNKICKYLFALIGWYKRRDQAELLALCV